MKNYVGRTAALLIGLTTLMGGSALAMDNHGYPKTITATPKFSVAHNKATGAMHISAAAVCISGGAKSPSHNLSASINEAAGTIDVTGHFSYRLDRPYLKRDCGPSLRHEMVVKNVSDQAYVLKFNGKEVTAVKAAQVPFGKYQLLDIQNAYQDLVNTTARVELGALGFKAWKKKRKVKPVQDESFHPRGRLLKTRMALTWTPETQVVELLLSSRCLATTARGVSGTFEAHLDENTNTIHLVGDYRQRPNEGFHIGTADCMGTRRDGINLSGVAPGDYSLSWNGHIVWRGELGSSDVQHSLRLN